LQGKLEQSRKGQPDLEVSYGDNDLNLVYVGDQIKTVDELISHAEIDLTIWEVSEVTVNNWEVAGKRKDSEKREQLWKTGLRQIKVKLRRKAPKRIQDGIKALIADMPKAVVPTPRKASKSADHLVELSLYDAHLGKLCWGPETGADYDLKIASSDYAGAVDDLLEKLSGFAVEQIKFPVGNDFMNVNSWARTTAKGTVVESTDDRITKVFKAAYGAVRDAVVKCSEIAPVEIIWVPGNHDPETSWYLCELLKEVYRGSKRISVDNSEKTRKYQLYGISLIGWNHSDGVSLDKLAALMPIECDPEMWAKSVYRHLRVGHWHKAKQIRHVNRDTFHGVDVSVIPSLSGTDKWHYDQGYVGNLRTAEVAIWNRHTGFAGAFPVEARSAVENRRKASANG
jgi:hypothetical protein